MRVTKQIGIDAELVVKEGVSKKTGNSYRMTFLVVHTEIYGDVEILLDTKNDRAGILLDLFANT